MTITNIRPGERIKVASRGVTSTELAAALAGVDIDTANLLTNAVTTLKIADGAVTAAKLANNAVTANKIDSLAVTTAKLDSVSVTTAKLGDLAVTTAKIDDASVTNGKLATHAVTQLKIAVGTITGDRLADDTIDTINIADDAVTQSKLGDLSVNSDKLGTAAVITAKLNDEAVTNAKIGDGAVTQSKLGDLAVNSAKLGTAAVTTAKLDADAVTNAKIGDGAVTESKLGDLSVASAKLGTASVTEAKLATHAVTQIKIAVGTITGDRLADDTIDTINIADDAVTQSKLGDLSVNSAKLGTGAVTEAKLGDLAVTAGKIGTAAVTTTKIDLLAVNTGRIADLAVTDAKLNTSAVTTAKIDNLAVTTGKINDLAITAEKLNTAAVETLKIADGAVTTGKLDLLAVTENRIDTGAVTNAKLGNLSVTTGKINDLAITADKLNTAAVETLKIQDGAVTTGKLASGAVNTLRLGDLAVTEAKLASVAVSTAKIVNLAVTTGKINDLAVTEDKLGETSVSTSKIQSGAVTEERIASGAVTFDKLSSELQEHGRGLDVRPGNRPYLFTEDLLGTFEDTDPLSGIPLAHDTDGKVLRVTAAHVVASRRVFRIEPGHNYKVRAEVRRRINPADPSNDAVALKIQWLDMTQAVDRGTTIVQNENELLTANGRFSLTGTFSLDAMSGIDHIAPATAKYGRAYVETFGMAQTDVELIEVTDITEASIVDTGDSGLNARITAIETETLPVRLEVVEAFVAGSQIARFKTRAAAVAAAAGADIPASTDIVEVLSLADDDDGVFATYVRNVSDAGSDDFFEDDDGTFWVRALEKVLAKNSLFPRTFVDRFYDTVNVMDHGAIGDGTAHTLTSLGYATLGAAQVDYPAALDLSDEADWCAWQHAVNVAALTGKRLRGPTGIYWFNRELIVNGNVDGDFDTAGVNFFATDDPLGMVAVGRNWHGTWIFLKTGTQALRGWDNPLEFAVVHFQWANPEWDGVSSIDHRRFATWRGLGVNGRSGANQDDATYPEGTFSCFLVTAWDVRLKECFGLEPHGHAFAEHKGSGAGELLSMNGTNYQDCWAFGNAYSKIGWYRYAGDAKASDFEIAGFDYGVWVASGGGSIDCGVHVWACRIAGGLVSVAAGNVNLNGLFIYDNYGTGLILSGTGATSCEMVVLSGCQFWGNGKDDTLTLPERAGIRIKGLATSIVLSGVSSGNHIPLGMTSQTYGLYCDEICTLAGAGWDFPDNTVAETLFQPGSIIAPWGTPDANARIRLPNFEGSGVGPEPNLIALSDFSAWSANTAGTAVPSAINTETATGWTHRRSAAGITVSRVTGILGSLYALQAQRTAADTSTNTHYFFYRVSSRVAASLATHPIVVSYDVQAGADFSGVGLQLHVLTGTGADEVIDAATPVFPTGSTVSSDIAGAGAPTTTAVRKVSASYTVPSGTRELALRFSYPGHATPAGAADLIKVGQIKLERGTEGSFYRPAIAPFDPTGYAPEPNLILNADFATWTGNPAGTAIPSGTNTETATGWIARRSATGVTAYRGTGILGSLYTHQLQRTAGNTSTNTTYLFYTLPSRVAAFLADKWITISYDVLAGADFSGGGPLLHVLTGTGVDEVINAGTPVFATGSVVSADIKGAGSATTTAVRKASTPYFVPSTATELAVRFSYPGSAVAAGAADILKIGHVKLEIGARATVYRPEVS